MIGETVGLKVSEKILGCEAECEGNLELLLLNSLGARILVQVLGSGQRGRQEDSRVTFVKHTLQTLHSSSHYHSPTLPASRVAEKSGNQGL